MNPTTTIALTGCKPSPLAHYLKALAILRLVAEQADSSARGYWKDDQFHLVSRLSKPDLVAFFLNDYQFSPVIAPWNGGSGFNPNDNTTAIDAIILGESARHSLYRDTIFSAQTILENLSITEKVASDQKPELLSACRAF